MRTTPRVPRLDVPLLSFKQYMEMQSDPIDIHDAEKHYAEYKQIYTNKQNDIFFECHKVLSVSSAEGALVQGEVPSRAQLPLAGRTTAPSTAPSQKIL